MSDPRPPVFCTGGCDACRDYAREMGVALVVPDPPVPDPLRAALAEALAVHRGDKRADGEDYESAVAILAALPPGWCGHSCAYMALESSVQSQAIRITDQMAEIARLRTRMGAALAAVEALPTWDKRTVPGGFHVNRAAVVAILRATLEEDR